MCVCLSVGHTVVPCENGWTDRNPVWVCGLIIGLPDKITIYRPTSVEMSSMSSANYDVLTRQIVCCVLTF